MNGEFHEVRGGVLSWRGFMMSLLTSICLSFSDVPSFYLNPLSLNLTGGILSSFTNHVMFS